MALREEVAKIVGDEEYAVREVTANVEEFYEWMFSDDPEDERKQRLKNIDKNASVSDSLKGAIVTVVEGNKEWVKDTFGVELDTEVTALELGKYVMSWHKWYPEFKKEQDELFEADHQADYDELFMGTEYGIDEEGDS